MSYEQLTQAVDNLAVSNATLTQSASTTLEASRIAADKAETASVRATSAADTAQLSAGIYDTTALGLTATNTGTQKYFSVPSADSSEYLILYKNNAGVAAEVKRYPSASAVQANAASLKKKADGLPGKNLFNSADVDVALGYFPNNNTGVLQANVNYNTSGYVPVVAGKSYTFSIKHYVAWYSSSKVFISGTSDANSNKTQVAPAGAAFVRASASTGNNWNFFQIEEGASQTSYEAYTTRIMLDPASVGQNSLSGSVIVAESLTQQATTFLRLGKNLFNKSAVSLSFIVSNVTGVLQASVSYDTSDFIPVTAGQQYTANKNMRFTCYFDSTKAVVVTGGVSSDITTFTPPASAKYIRVSTYKADLAAFQLEAGAVITSYEDYGWKILGPNGEKLIQEPVGTASLQDASVTREKTNFLKAGKNLFNKAAATIGQFIDPPSGGMTASATYDTTEKIQVTAGQQYVSNRRMRFSCYFAANGSSVVAGGLNDGSGVFTFTAPTGAAYVRVTLWHTDLDMFQLEKGGVATAFESYGWKVEGPNGEGLIGTGSGATTGSKWSGKTWATLGDSITAGGLWQPGAVTSLGLRWSNFGIGGTKVSGSVGDANAMCQDTRINAIPTTQDLVTVMGGTNDWAQNVPLGAVDSADPLTFYGALNTMVTKLMARFPAKRVVLFTTPYGEIYDYVPRGWSNAYTNTQGLTPRDYAEAVRTACKRWGLPCVDVQANAGWNTLNIRTYLNDDGALLHPNAVGAARVSEVVIGSLRSLEPLA